MPKQNIEWKILRFEQLTTLQLYKLLQLRVAVFVVEQTCSYQELDDKDLHNKTYHILGYLKGEIIAYSRVIAPKVSYDAYASIGRVIIDASLRGKGVSEDLITQSIGVAREYWPTAPIKISAQEPLKNFYNQFGFKEVSSMYLEDNIPHIAMIFPVKRL